MCAFLHKGFILFFFFLYFNTYIYLYIYIYMNVKNVFLHGDLEEVYMEISHGFEKS